MRAAPPAGARAAGRLRPVLSRVLDERAWPLRVGLLLALAAALLLPGLGQAPLERAEIYFLDGARSMLERQDLLVPYYRGEPFFDKPPLTYWLMAAAFRVLGFDPGAARVVPAVAALLVLLATLWLGRILFDRRTAFAGAVVLATTGGFIGFGRIAMSDMLLALWSTLAMAIALRALRADAHPAWPVALAAVLGLGFLTKGPIALLLPGLGFAWLAWTRRADVPRVRAWIAGVAVVVFAAVALGWFVAVERRLGWGPLAHFFLRENLQRFAADTYDAQRPFWYYVPTFLAVGAPWSLFLPLAAWRALGREDGASRFLLAWLALMLVPLSLSRGKIDYYLLPLYPAASLVVARLFTSVPWRALERSWTRVVLAIAVVALALMPAFLFGQPEQWVPPRVALGAMSALMGLAVLACVVAAVRPSAARTLATLALSAALVIGTLGSLVVPAFHAAQPLRQVVEDVKREQRYRSDASVVACADPLRVQRDLLFHARTVMEERCDLWALASSSHPFLLLLDAEQRRSLLAGEGVREVARYRYLPATALTLAGLLDPPAPSEMTLAANFPTDDPVAETKRKRERKRALRDANE
ncbi:MAG TPA: glycosyltransferase family 39 protein [Vicinamibacteria bacterium]|nr:glycosyltransferase family 39 protein [Vicinamibacteria bacterium]